MANAQKVTEIMKMKSASENVKTEIAGNKLTIAVDLAQNFGQSKSGKSTIIASTLGNMQVSPGVFIGVNVYRK